MTGWNLSRKRSRFSHPDWLLDRLHFVVKTLQTKMQKYWLFSCNNMYLWKCHKSWWEKKYRGWVNLAELTNYIKQIDFFLLCHIINMLLTKLSQSLGRINWPQLCIHVQTECRDHFQTFCEHFCTFSEDYQRWPQMFWSYCTPTNLSVVKVAAHSFCALLLMRFSMCTRITNRYVIPTAIILFAQFLHYFSS